MPSAALAEGFFEGRRKTCPWLDRATRSFHFRERIHPELLYYASIRGRIWGAVEKSLTERRIVMAWVTPVFEEVVLCCEINSYVSAKL